MALMIENAAGRERQRRRRDIHCAPVDMAPAVFRPSISDFSTVLLPAINFAQSVMLLLKPFQKIAAEIVTPSAFVPSL
jgi:hypothetical protein